MLLLVPYSAGDQWQLLSLGPIYLLPHHHWLCCSSFPDIHTVPGDVPKDGSDGVTPLLQGLQWLPSA